MLKFLSYVKWTAEATIRSYQYKMRFELRCTSTTKLCGNKNSLKIVQKDQGFADDIQPNAQKSGHRVPQ